MAVMTARSIARRLVNVQYLSSLYHQAVEELRRDTVKTTVDTLWRRYKTHQTKYREEPRSFVEWLVWKEHLENTFWHVTTGSSLPTRRGWAIRYHRFLTRKELTLADDPDNLWVFDALQDAINAKHDDPEWLVTVEAVEREGIPRYHLPPGVSFAFGKVEREEPSMEDWLLTP